MNKIQLYDNNRLKYDKIHYMNPNNTNFYQFLPLVYDEMTGDISADQWGSYLNSFIDMEKPEILEYACGTGKITKELIKKTDNIVAVDISPEMLSIAEKKLRHNGGFVNFSQFDMINFVLNKQVDFAICACDGVNYITRDKDLNKFFLNVYNNLKNNGCFLFDISSNNKLKNILGNEFYYNDDDNATLFWQNTYNNDNSILKMDLTLFLKSGDIYNRYDEIHFQRAWSTDEIIRGLMYAGFNNIEVYTFNTKNRFKDTDERIQFMARK